MLRDVNCAKHESQREEVFKAAVGFVMHEETEKMRARF